MNKQILLLTIGIILVMGLASAEDQPLKLNKAQNLSLVCYNNHTYCSASAICNITIFYPDGRLFVSNQNMTNKINYHYLSLTFPESGQYRYSMLCIDGGNLGNTESSFIVSPSGYYDNFWFVVILILICGALILLGIVREDVWVGILGSYGMVAISIYTIVNGFGMFRDFRTEVVSFILLFFSMYISIKGTLELIEQNL